MHLLIRLILQRAPADARVLCVGVGTGAEILALSKVFPGWTFVAIDPAKGMLEVCRERLQQAGILERCELIHGYLDEVAQGEGFDVVLNILVAHFVKRDDRRGLYQAMWSRLRENGHLISTEISYDLTSETYPLMLDNWREVQLLMGASVESLAKLPLALRNQLTVISSQDTDALLKQSGIDMPVRFFQAFMINGWYAIKSSGYL
ncbi:SAM-dependent methyltransferase [Aliidiomarina soli]|uniref:SAM-dependent methyltransferase n=2 Tax=Aliidiomarina soli TaxID=1928574 RepID=A0A432WMY6_9GAMM|nr:SAM-dependent methyltransferase [Aliidiomarina soli]